MRDITELHSERMAIAAQFAGTFGLFSIPLSLAVAGAVYVIAGTGLGAAIGLSATFGTAAAGFALCEFACALVIARALIGGLADSRWMLVNLVSDYLDSQDAAREAQAAALARARAAAQINVNSGAGAMTVTNKSRPIIYRVHGNVQTLQLNPGMPSEARTLCIPAADVRWFCEQIAGGYGFTKAKWLGQELPYSRTLVTWLIYKTLVDSLAAGGGIAGRGPRAAGRLVEKDPAQLVKIIEATYPDAGRQGITLTLPESTESAPN